MIQNLLFFIGLSIGLDVVSGHGAMYLPSPWHATSDCNTTMPNGKCKFDLVVPETPDYKCSPTANGEWKGCSRNAGLVHWFTNYTTVQEKTLEKYMYDKWSWKSSEAGLHPWNSPGAAPVQGNGCGVNGGNQFGCPIGDDLVHGRCCHKNGGCGGYEGGKPALEHYQDGLFGTPRTTTWRRGEPAEVYWGGFIGHRGGYAYRLCRVNNGEVWKVTEECFQQGHLNFHGKTSWIHRGGFPYYGHGNYTEEEGWQAINLVSSTKGTTPPGSQWAKIDLPQKEGSKAFKDLVEVPESLAPGEYVLSFRWDCQRTPQVWNACANIEIV